MSAISKTLQFAEDVDQARKAIDEAIGPEATQALIALAQQVWPAVRVAIAEMATRTAIARELEAAAVTVRAPGVDPVAVLLGRAAAVRAGVDLA